MVPRKARTDVRVVDVWEAGVDHQALVPSVWVVGNPPTVATLMDEVTGRWPTLLKLSDSEVSAFAQVDWSDVTGKILAADNVATPPVLASEALVAAFEHVVVRWIAAIRCTAVDALLVDRRPPWPRSQGPSPCDQLWFTPACAAARTAWRAAWWVGESGDVVAFARWAFRRICR